MAQDFHRETWYHVNIVRLISSDHSWSFVQVISVFMLWGAHFPCQEGLVLLGMLGALMSDQVTKRNDVSTH